MSDRNTLIDVFLTGSEWATADKSILAGDASNRRYLRLHHEDGRTAVLMDAPPDKGEDTRPFVRINRFLRDAGLSAPEISITDEENGFLLLEDLGDDLFARVVVDQPNLEAPLYEAATDTLLALHKHRVPRDLATYDPKTMAEMSALAYRWYLRGLDLPYEVAAQSFEAEFKKILQATIPMSDVLIQRDYHAENLLWLPDRTGVARVGLLDFQDAMAGHRAYDLVSLLQDARRDVPGEIEKAMIDRYVCGANLDSTQFDAAYHLLGAQRNLRIIGVFARLSMHFSKAHYVDFIPRVWGYLERDLSNPALSSLRGTLAHDLPFPSASNLEKLKEKCGSIPTL